MEYLCPYSKSGHGLMNCFPRGITPRDVLLSWEYHSYALSNPYQERHGLISVSILLVVLQCGQKCAAAGGQLLASLDHVTRPETLESEMPLHWTDAPIKPHRTPLASAHIILQFSCFILREEPYFNSFIFSNATDVFALNENRSYLRLPSDNLTRHSSLHESPWLLSGVTCDPYDTGSWQVVWEHEDGKEPEYSFSALSRTTTHISTLNHGWCSSLLTGKLSLSHLSSCEGRRPASQSACHPLGSQHHPGVAGLMNTCASTMPWHALLGTLLPTPNCGASDIYYPLQGRSPTSWMTVKSITMPTTRSSGSRMSTRSMVFRYPGRQEKHDLHRHWMEQQFPRTEKRQSKMSFSSESQFPVVSGSCPAADAGRLSTSTSLCSGRRTLFLPCRGQM